MFPKLYNLVFWCSFTEEYGPAGQAVCSIRQLWKCFLREEICSLNGGREISWSRAWHYSQMAQSENEWEVSLERDSVERSGGGIEGQKRKKIMK